MKGTIVGVAPQFGGGTPSVQEVAPEAAAPAAPPQAVNPLGGTMAADGPMFAPAAPAPYGAAMPDPGFGATPAPAAGGWAPEAAAAPPGAGGWAPEAAAQAPPGAGGWSPEGAGPPAGGYGAPAGMGAGYGAGAPDPGYGAGAAMGGYDPSQGGAGAAPYGQYPGQGQAMAPYQGGGMMHGGGMGGGPMVPQGQSDKSWLVTLLLCLFAGTFGAHRFYTGHIGIAVGQLLTLGGCGIWALVDLIFILIGKYTDKQGRPLARG